MMQLDLLTTPRARRSDPVTSHQALTAERLRELLHYDPATGVFIWRVPVSNVKAGSIAGRVNSRGYWQIGVDAKQYLSHRLAWVYVYGTWPKNQIDHIDGDRLNTCIKNLRDVMGSVNNQNLRRAHSKNKLGILGVSPYRGKCRAVININGKQIYLGLFDEPEIAHTAYLEAKRALHPGCTI